MRAENCNLPQKSIDYLQDLIQVNIDSRDGFQEAADHLKSEGRTDLELLFAKLARERDIQAKELQELVSCNAQSPADSGSIAAAAHRTWLNIREAFGGGEQAVLDEAERGEDHIKDKYETAIKDLGTCSCTQTLRRHYANVKSSHDQIRTLRDQCSSHHHHV
jgi:uncharacterized protein (TIGR02284 family)